MTRRATLLPTVVVVLGFLVLLILSRGHPYLTRFPLAAVSPLVFLLVQTVSPRMRLQLDRPLSPANWAWFLFGVLLVLEPALLLSYGPSRGQLAALPQDRAINEAITVTWMAYIAFSVGLAAWDRRPAPTVSRYTRLSVPTQGVAIAFIIVGGIGVLLNFHSVSGLVGYFSGKGGGDIHAQALAPSSFGPAASVFLRPFGAYGFLMLWARSATPAAPHRLRLVLCAGAAMGIFATYSYERSTVVIPLTALAAAYGHHIRRIPTRTVFVAALVVLLTAFSFENFRRTAVGTEGGAMTLQQAGLTRPAPSLQENVQVYGSAPQFTGEVIQHVSATSDYRLGQSLLPSVLAPVPVLAKPLRSASGAALYNKLIYGTIGTVDQIIAFPAELYWNAGPIGVAGGFIVVGMLVSATNRRFERSRSLFSAFVYQFVGMEVAFLALNSLSNSAQFLIYFLPPALAAAVLNGRRVDRSDDLRALPQASGPRSDGAGLAHRA